MSACCREAGFCLIWDRRFESVSLQRRVACEPERSPLLRLASDMSPSNLGRVTRSQPGVGNEAQLRCGGWLSITRPVRASTISAPSPAFAAARAADCASISSLVRTKRLPITRISKVGTALCRPISSSVINKLTIVGIQLFRAARTLFPQLDDLAEVTTGRRGSGRLCPEGVS